MSHLYFSIISSFLALAPFSITLSESARHLPPMLLMVICLQVKAAFRRRLWCGCRQ